jgi:hypothetical protein
MISSEEAIEPLYKAGVSFGVFDRRKLWPTLQLADAVEAETAHRVSESDLGQFASDGWYQPLPLQGGQAGTGVPLVVASRIGLFLELRERGYLARELRSWAAWEDYWIDNFSELELDYEDDDLRLLLRHQRDRLVAAESRMQMSEKGSPDSVEAERDVEKAKAEISILAQLQGRILNYSQEEKIKHAAYSVRALDECLRLCFIEQDRAKMRQGYSPFIIFRKERWSLTSASFQDIDWSATLRVPWLEEWAIGIRLPELILDGDKITTIMPLIPSTYKRAWVERNLDRYFETLAELNQETRCLHCRSVLLNVRNSRQRYCSDTCRNSAKQRRLRVNNPDSVFKAQSKYYVSLRDGDVRKDRSE